MIIASASPTLQQVTDAGAATTDTVTAHAFAGDGSALTNLPAPTQPNPWTDSGGTDGGGGYNSHSDSGGDVGQDYCHGDIQGAAYAYISHADTSGYAGAINSHANTYGVALGVYSFACGQGAKATLHGQKAFGNGILSGFGDAQGSLIFLRGQSTDTTPTLLSLDGFGAQYSPPPNAGQLLRISIIGLKDDHTTIARFIRDVLITNSGGSSVTIADAQTVGTDVNPGTWGGISVGASGGTLTVTVTGAAGTNINWVGKIETVETIN